MSYISLKIQYSLGILILQFMKNIPYIWIATVLFFISISTVLYALNHGAMRMDRIFSQSDDGSLLFIGEMIRQQILWPLYIHSYVFNSSIEGITKSENISFYALGVDIVANNQLVSFSQWHNYETTTSDFLLDYVAFSGSNLNIKSEPLHASFVTKTDPNYFRYLSNGNWTMHFNGIRKSGKIFTDTIISADSLHAYLKKWTKVQGYMGWYWGTGWTLDYFDISKILERGKWETYEDHSYLLSIDSNKKNKKKYGLTILEENDIFSVVYEKEVILRVDTKNIIKIWQGNMTDTYYTFIGENWAGKMVRWFLNFVK